MSTTYSLLDPDVRVNALQSVMNGFKLGYATVTEATDAALVSVLSRLGVLEGTVATFVSGSIMTAAQLFANYPAGSDTRGKYARISNYGGFVDRVVRCDYDSDLNYYFWTPTQPEYGRSVPLTANMTLLALVSPQSVNLTGTIGVGVTRNVTIDLTNRRPGEIVEIKAGVSSLLGSLNILGTGLGSGLGLLVGNYAKFLIDGSGGSLALVRLV